MGLKDFLVVLSRTDEEIEVDNDFSSSWIPFNFVELRADDVVVGLFIGDAATFENYDNVL